MKKVKFKSKKFIFRHKVLFTIILSLAISFCITTYISNKISDKILFASSKLIEKESLVSLKSAYSKREKSGIDVDNLITVVKNSKEEIVEVDFKILECEKIMMTIINYMNADNDILNENGYRIDVPLGYVTSSPLFVNLGPKIPISVKMIDVALGSVKTKISEFGINNALVELYIDITIKLESSLPLVKNGTSVTYYSVIASKIISGKVPDFYNGVLSSESKTFNLPISE